MDLSKDDLQPFNPRDPLYRGKLWVRVVTPDSVWWHFFWGRIALAGLAVIVAGWLAAATAVWAFVRIERGYTDVSYLDLAFYPFRAAHYRAGLGQHYLALGRAELEKKNYRTGYSLLLAGLARAPDDVAARRLVAITEIRLGIKHRALQTLADGATLATADLDYHKLMFALLLDAQEDDRVIALAAQLLPAKPDGVLIHEFIALQAATAHFQRGRYDQAERIVADWHLDQSLEGAILLAECDWERGYTDLALMRLQDALTRFSQRDELYFHLSRFHRELGHLDEARRYVLLRHLSDPKSPRPRIDLLLAYHASDDRAVEARELDAFLADFKGDASALELLADFAVETVQPSLAQRVHDLAAARNFPLNAFNLARVKAAIAAADYGDALSLADTALREENESNTVFSATLNGLRALALFGLHDTSRAELTLGSFLNQTDLRAINALVLAKQLRLLGVPDQARIVLERLCTLDPLNQAALGELVRLDAESGDRAKLTDDLAKFLRLRKPSRAVLEETLLHLDQPADTALREQVRAAIARATATPAPG